MSTIAKISICIAAGLAVVLFAGFFSSHRSNGRGDRGRDQAGAYCAPVEYPVAGWPVYRPVFFGYRPEFERSWAGFRPGFPAFRRFVPAGRPFGRR